MAQYFINSQQLDQLVEMFYLNNERHINKCYIIDLRSEQEYNEGHIKYAVNCSYDIFDEKIERELSKYQRIMQTSKEDAFEQKIDFNLNNIYILYCNRGTLSYMMASKMIQRGYYARTLSGGYLKYFGKYKL